MRNDLVEGKDHLSRMTILHCFPVFLQRKMDRRLTQFGSEWYELAYDSRVIPCFRFFPGKALFFEFCLYIPRGEIDPDGKGIIIFFCIFRLYIPSVLAYTQNDLCLIMQFIRKLGIIKGL